MSTTEAVAVELTADALRAHSDRPIAVEASVRPDEFVLDAPIAIEGIGTLPTSVGLSGLSMGRDGVAMTVEVSVGLDGVDSRGRQNPNRFLVSVSGLECPSLRARGDVHAVGEARALEDGTLRVADGPVSLAPAPEGSPLVVLRPRGDAPLTVWETQRRGEWVRVGFRWSSELGAGELRGWVEAPALRTPSEGEAQSVERALAALPLRVGILGAGGGGSDLGGLLSGVRDCAGSYDGESKPARIRTGTPVLASPGGERWGRIQEEDGYVVGDGERDGYLPVISASGLRGLVRCPRFGDRGGSPAPAAWVESASVQWAP